METLVGVFRCLLPVRYWQEMRRGALLSVFATAGTGIWAGLAGFFEHARQAGEAAARLALGVGAPGGGVASMDQTTQVTAALHGMILTPIAYFMFTPSGWLADYLVLSAVFRGVTLAVDNPWGDPILTAIDHMARDRRAATRAKNAAAARERAEGPIVRDQIRECRTFEGKEADYVVTSSRRKDGWTPATTVIADSIRLRIGDPIERTIEGRLRTCYPLKIIRDIQVDRRIVHYKWPRGGPPLPQADVPSEE